MDTNNNTPNQKGLGWIPDYPDIRDYRLGTDEINDLDGRLKREDNFQEVEQLAQGFSNVLEEFKKLIDLIDIKKPNEQVTTLETVTSNLKATISSQLDEIQSTIFGDISFQRVNLYRQLRLGAKAKPPFATEEGFLYESEVAKRILELKGCLYYIFRAKTPPCPDVLLDQTSLEKNAQNDARRREIVDQIQNTRKLLEALPNPNMFEWLRKAEFDKDTELLVQLFQFCAGIWEDGIVGLETYTTLNKYLNFSKAEEFSKFNHKFVQFFNPLKDQKKYPNSYYQPNFCLLPVSLLLPTVVFERILNQLELWAWTSKVAGDLDFFEEDYLREKLAVKNPKIFTQLLKKTKSKLEEKNSPQEICCLREFFFREASSFKAVFQEEFLLVEPIVSVIIKLLTPLADFRNDSLESAVSKGLVEFEQLFSSSQLSESEEKFLAALLDNVKPENGLSEDDTQQVALQALEGVRKVFDAEIEAKIWKREEEKKNKGSERQAEDTLYFYFLIKKLVRLFGVTPKPANVNSSGSDASNPFEKQEVFEIIAQPPSRKENLIEVFKIPRLQIPLKRKALESFAFDESKTTEIKNYLFLPGVIDLSYWCSEIEDQGSLNSCTALAGVALYKYFVNRTNNRYTDVSSLFLYKTTRNLMNLKGDVGASVREMMKAMALFGVPPEQYWQYDESKVDEEPPSFCYSFGQNFQALKYFRLDYAGISKEVLLLQIKAVIATGFPCVFGFTMYTSAYEASNQQKGWIPFPDYKKDRVVGGHAVVAVGYDDYKKIERKDRNKPDGLFSEGAFLIRNSFGADWGANGYGWLPYDYVLAGLTADWWSLLKAEWFNDAFWEGVRGSQGPDPGIQKK